MTYRTSTDNDEDFSILEEDNSQIYAHLDNVLVHMIDKEETVILNQNKILIKIYQICRKLASCISHMFLYNNGM